MPEPNPTPPSDAPTFPDTRPTLLQRLPDANDGEAWRSFVETYGPLVYRFALRRGLQPSDAADVVQEVMLKVARSIDRFDYDPDRGRFRGWLFTIAWRALIDRANRIKRRSEIAGDGIAERTADPSADAEALWDSEYRRSLLHRALPLVRPQFSESTWEAFRLTTLEGQPAEEIARRLGLTIGSVYVARSRVTARLRDRIRQIEAEWEAAAATPLNA
ncbi:MAG: sigma-70 family RNA polymerase sigma factor [Verrucomicrobiae bacterium]|nr:sigma-70 family RNA polymerase sigma factor [Verrucomicrobiae bacterium]